jgi:hypothetical protein
VSDPGRLRPAPHLVIRDALGADAHRRIVEIISEQVTRAGLESLSGWLEGADVHRCVDLAVDLGASFDPLESLLGDMAPVARRELDLPHFQVAATPHQVTVHGPGGDAHTVITGDSAPAGRRIDFVYTCSAVPAAFDGGSIRLYDTVEVESHEHVAESFTEVEPADNSLVLFPSGCHHEVTRTTAAGRGVGAEDQAIRYTVSGWLAGDPAWAPLPSLQPPVMLALQVHYLPKVSPVPFEVRPMPEWVHRFFTGLLGLRGRSARPEGADEQYHRGEDPTMVGIEDVADDVLRRFKPLHEQWCGTELVASAAYGMRCYRPGSSLDMHIDRAATHVVSSILQVDQDVDEPWPLELDVDGRTHAVVLSPGQMLLYEGASTPHGRPSPLAGRSFVNVFLHYRPVDWPWSPSLLTRRGLEDGLIDDAGRLL